MMKMMMKMMMMMKYMRHTRSDASTHEDVRNGNDDVLERKIRSLSVVW